VAKTKIEHVLVNVPLFEGLSRRHLKHLAGISEVQNYMEGAAIVREGEPGDSFYVVLAGQAKVTVGKRTLNRVFPGDFFGEIALLDGEPRTATVMSETPMTLLMLSRQSFQKALKDDPGISLQIASSLARRVRQTSRSLVG
jgi:CRP/FNR family cyclic AMP-dependent transcriptional regulator